MIWINVTLHIYTAHFLFLSFFLFVVPLPPYNMPHASCLLSTQLEEKGRRICGMMQAT